MDQDQKKNDFNLKDILLPKKEERTSASASRINAGVLFEGEQQAELPKQEAAPIAPQQKREGPVDNAPIAPLQTYQSDVESVITQKNISAVDIVAAESVRSGKGKGLFALPKGAIDFAQIKKAATFISAGALFTVAIGLLYFVFLRPTPQAPGLAAAIPPFISIDDTQALIVSREQFTRSTLMDNLENLKEKTAVSLGLMSRIYVAISTTTAVNELPPAVTSQALLKALAPNISDEFLRAIDPTQYLLGVHVFDGSQAFLILKVESYEQGFSGMLAWERTVSQELSPFFTRTPRPRLPGEEPQPSTPAVTLSPTPFQDKIVENHDARVIVNDQGDILLLWAFLDRDTLVITTNEATLREIISRRSSFTPGV